MTPFRYCSAKGISNEIHRCALSLLFTMSFAQNTDQYDINVAERFANLALACVHKEYPNKISHTLNSDADVAPPRKLTPAFYGCYDWHSSVHGHWLLVRLMRTFPNAPFIQAAREALRQSLTAENIAQEAEYLRGRRSCIIEERGTPRAVLLSIRDYVKLVTPEGRYCASSERSLSAIARTLSASVRLTRSSSLLGFKDRKAEATPRVVIGSEGPRQACCWDFSSLGSTL